MTKGETGANRGPRAQEIDLEGLFTRWAQRLWPTLIDLDPESRIAGIGDVLSTLYVVPLALLGIGWLVAVTDLSTLQTHWPFLLFLFLLITLFGELSFFITVELRAGRYANSGASLDGVIQWTALFLLGPTSLWLWVLYAAASFARDWPKARSISARWDWLRNFVLTLAVNSLAPLVALQVYERLGGTYPLPSLSLDTILLGMVTLGVYFIAFNLIYLGFVAYILWAQRRLSEHGSAQPVLRLLLLSLGLPHLAHPFSVLAAGLFVSTGLAGFLFFLSGLMFVALLARQVSQIGESHRQQTQELEALERLGRDLIESPPDGSELSEILARHVPRMFPASRIAIWVLPNEFLLVRPPGWTREAGRFWNWMRDQTEARALHARESLPWAEEEDDHAPAIVTPIFDVETLKPLGGIYIELQNLIKPWDRTSLESLLPAVQSLAAQIASALHQAKQYRDLLTTQQTMQEVRLAGEIQASFLPNEFPISSGWELAVTILPARETSGDYFDFIPLTDERLGILIADVADKGVGPALYMALSRTLIRTYAREFALDPDVVFFAANGRILEDARANLFVTAFYGVLDQSTGAFSYCNAGHLPPYLIRTREEGRIEELGITGIPIGVEKGAVWRVETVQINPGDVLVLYTDGIPDAENDRGERFKQRSLLETAQSCLDIPAQQIQANIIEAVRDFVGEAPQGDDITLMVLVRGGREGS